MCARCPLSWNELAAPNSHLTQHVELHGSALSKVAMGGTILTLNYIYILDQHVNRIVPNLKTNIHKYESTTQCTGHKPSGWLNLHVVGADGISNNYHHHQCIATVLHASCLIQAQFLICHFQWRKFNPSQCCLEDRLQVQRRGKERCSYTRTTWKRFEEKDQWGENKSKVVQDLTSTWVAESERSQIESKTTAHLTRWALDKEGRWAEQDIERRWNQRDLVETGKKGAGRRRGDTLTMESRMEEARLKIRGQVLEGLPPPLSGPCIAAGSQCQWSVQPTDTSHHLNTAAAWSGGCSGALGVPQP